MEILTEVRAMAYTMLLDMEILRYSVFTSGGRVTNMWPRPCWVTGRRACQLAVFPQTPAATARQTSGTGASDVRMILLTVSVVAQT